MKSPCEKKEGKSQKPCWYRYGCSWQASEINPAARWGLCLGNHCKEVTSERKANATWRLSRGEPRAGDAVADRSFSAQAIQESLGAGSALRTGAAAWALRSLRPGGLECSRGRRERGLRLKTLHCTGTQHGRDTREPGYNRNTGQAARRASQQRKPSSWQLFTWAGFSGVWHFVSQCNFTRVCLCVCVCVSLQYKQKATRRKLINFKIWNREQVNKIHSKMWLIVWIPYIKSQHIYHFSLSIKTSLMDKSSMRCISALVILNPMKTHLFTTDRTIWRVEHAVSFKVCTVFKVLLTY